MDGNAGPAVDDRVDAVRGIDPAVVAGKPRECAGRFLEMLDEPPVTAAGIAVAAGALVLVLGVAGRFLRPRRRQDRQQREADSNSDGEAQHGAIRQCAGRPVLDVDQAGLQFSKRGADRSTRKWYICPINGDATWPRNRKAIGTFARLTSRRSR